MGKIKLEDGKYTRNKLPYEEDDFTIDGVKYDREKVFLIEDDKLDEYTRQLERENKELKCKYAKDGRVLFTIEAINERYIPKSEIIEKIEKLTPIAEKLFEKGDLVGHIAISSQIDVLEELLGEEK